MKDPEGASISEALRALAEKPMNEARTDKDVIIQVLRYYSEKGQTLAFCAGPKILNRKIKYLQGICKKEKIDFPDFCSDPKQEMNRILDLVQGAIEQGMSLDGIIKNHLPTVPRKKLEKLCDAYGFEAVDYEPKVPTSQSEKGKKK